MRDFDGVMKSTQFYSTDVIWTLIMPMGRVSFCCQHASSAVGFFEICSLSINNIQDLEN